VLEPSRDQPSGDDGDDGDDGDANNRDLAAEG
jgi:hypothetical protein